MWAEQLAKVLDAGVETVSVDFKMRLDWSKTRKNKHHSLARIDLRVRVRARRQATFRFPRPEGRRRAKTEPKPGHEIR